VLVVAARPPPNPTPGPSTTQEIHEHTFVWSGRLGGLVGQQTWVVVVVEHGGSEAAAGSTGKGDSEVGSAEVESAEVGSAEGAGGVAAGVAGAPTERLEAEAIDLASRIAAGTARFLAVVAELDARESWRAWGCRSTAEWLGWRCGIDDRTAREHVRVARRLRDLPVVTEAFGTGRLSYSKVRAIARVATPETEDDLVTLARHGTAAHVDRIARGIRRAEALETTDATTRRARRTLRWWWDDDGSLVISGRLPPEDGAPVVAVLEALIAEQLAAECTTATAIAADASDATAAIAETASDATAAIADPASDATAAIADAASDADHVDRVAAVDGPATEASGGPAGPDAATGLGAAPAGAGLDATPAWAEPPVDRMGQRAADALTEMAHLVAGGRTGGVGVELQVLVDASLLVGAVEPDHGSDRRAHGSDGTAHGSDGRCHLVDGPALDRATLELLRCDSSVTALIEREGTVIASGPRTPTIAASTRRAVLARDRGCAFPCCRGRRVQLHHVRFRTRRGADSTANLVALCSYHHQLLHRAGWTIERDELGHVRFVLPTGQVIDAVPRDRTTRLTLQPATAGPAAVDSAWAGERLDLGVTVAELVRRRRAPGARGPRDRGGPAGPPR
jgi:hypothetical protein